MTFSLRRYLLVRLARLATYPTRMRLRRFEAACADPEAAQLALLQGILRRQAATGYSRDHHFHTIRSVAEFRRNVPIGPYEALAPYIARVEAGETTALLAEPKLHMFALTSGTTARRKLIPVTDSYLRSYRMGWNMWGVRMYRDHRGRKIAMRPIVQMVGDPDEFRTAAGIPCGNLSGYTAQVQMRLIRRLYAVPAISGKITDAQARYYVALRASIGRPVSQFMAANPSTLVQLARLLDANQESLIRDLADGTLRNDLNIPPELRAALAPLWKPNPTRARELEAAARNGHLFPKDVWPTEGIIIGTWTGGSMGPYLRQLPPYYGETPIRDLGLLASEGRMTIPFANHTPAGVLDIGSHYFEFIPEAEIDSPQPTVLGAHELQDGQTYYILPTTTYGLYRYHISDLVRVRGFLHRTPLVEFLGKGHRFANLTGEKLSEHQVTLAIASVLGQLPVPLGTYSLAPVWDEAKPYYGIYVESDDGGTGGTAEQFLRKLDAQLQEQNLEYAAKRDSGRLAPPRLF
ncbi:MAG: GH3 auxin-responsive promoter family protein, partial [Gemmataceae bacterium]